MISAFLNERMSAFALLPLKAASPVTTRKWTSIHATASPRFQPNTSFQSRPQNCASRATDSMSIGYSFRRTFKLA